MSWQATEAVRDNSKIDDPNGRLILMVIASYCKPDGTMNGVSRPPSIETIAMGAMCHKNTVINWITKLEQSGELLVQRTGKGRGAKNHYTIKLPIMAQEMVQPESANSAGMVQGHSTNKPDIASNGTTQDVPLGQNNGTSRLEIMVQNLAFMVEKLTVMVQGMVQNGTTQDVPITEYKTEEKENIYIHPLPPQIAKIVTELAAATKTPYGPGINEKEFEDAAYLIFGKDILPDKIAGFSSWWEKNGFYRGKPVLKSLLQELDNYLAGVELTKQGAKQHANGRHPPAQAEWSKEIVSNGRGW